MGSFMEVDCFAQYTHLSRALCPPQRRRRRPVTRCTLLAAPMPTTPPAAFDPVARRARPAPAARGSSALKGLCKGVDLTVRQWSFRLENDAVHITYASGERFDLKSEIVAKAVVCDLGFCRVRCFAIREKGPKLSPEAMVCSTLAYGLRYRCPD